MGRQEHLLCSLGTLTISVGWANTICSATVGVNHVGVHAPVRQDDVRPGSFQSVRQRQKAQGVIIRFDVEEHFQRIDLVGEATVPQHHAPWLTGGARRVDEGRQVVTGRGGQAGVHLGHGLRRGLGVQESAVALQALDRLDRDDPLEVRQVVSRLRHLEYSLAASTTSSLARSRHDVPRSTVLVA